MTLVTVVAPSGMKEEEAAPAAEAAAAAPAAKAWLSRQGLDSRRSSPGPIGFDAPTARPERFL